MTEVQIPTSWSRCTLSDVANITMGQSPPGSAYNDQGLGLPFFQGKAEFGPVHPTVKKWTTEGNKRAYSGDILMSVRAPVGPTNIADTECVIGRGLAAIRAREQMNQTFLLWFLRGVEGDIASRGTGTTFDSISGDSLRKQPVYVPPLQEQNEIVRILEEQFSRLDAAAASIAAVRRKADQFRRSLLNAAFSEEVTVCPPGSSERQVSWEFQRLGDCLEKLKSGKIAERGWSPQCLSYPSDDEGSWGVLKTTAVQMGEFQPEHNKELPKTLTPKTGLEVEDGDFLLISTSPRNRCGVVCQVKTTRKKLIFSGKILRFRVDEERVLADWLMFYLMSPKSQEELDVLKVGTSDSSVSIGNKQVLDLMIPVAPIDVQRLVTSLLDDEMTRLAVLLQTARTAEVRIAALRRSLLNSAFSGELTKEWREKNNG